MANNEAVILAMPANQDPQKEKDLPRYDEKFIGMQVAFAEKSAALSGAHLATTLNQMTLLPHLTGKNDLQSTVSASAADRILLVRNLHLDYIRNQDTKALAETRETDKRCIYATIEKDQTGNDVIFMHFHNRMPGDESPFSARQIPERQREIAQAIGEALREHPEITTVATRSWLCNHKGYQAAYPPQWTANMKPQITEGAFRRLDVWGQFIAKDGTTRTDRYEQFMHAIDQAQTPEELIKAFPYVPLYTSCPVEVFLQDPQLKELFEEFGTK